MEYGVITKSRSEVRKLIGDGSKQKIESHNGGRRKYFLICNL